MYEEGLCTSTVFGLIPLAGDVIAFLLSYTLVLKKCREAE